MMERHTFKALITSVVEIEKGINALESALNCHFDGNWLTEAPCNIIKAIAEGFFEKSPAERSIEDCQSETIEELLYHFIYMEDCGNDSEHCRERLVRVSNNEEEKPLSCTNIDELYTIICTYLKRDDLNFHFNYCHSHKLDDEIQEVI